MKRFISLLLALAMALSLVACGNGGSADTNQDANNADDQQTPAETVELTVFAAASLTESLTAIGEKYMAENENVKINFNFDSSGKLYTQIKEGAPCDLFISAAPKQMNQLDGTLKDAADKNPDGLDMLVEGSRLDLLENKVVLAVAEGSGKGIDSFDKLAELLKSGGVTLAIGNEDVPVGQYTKKIFAYYEIDEAAIAANLTYGSNVKEVTTAVSEGTVDCGIIYASDAYSAGLTVAAEATADMCGQVIYPAAVLNTSTRQEAAAAFLAYLQDADASSEFAKLMFTPLSKKSLKLPPLYRAGRETRPAHIPFQLCKSIAKNRNETDGIRRSPHGLVSPLKLAAYRRHFRGGGVLCGHRRGALYRKTPAFGQRYSGRDFDAAPSSAAYGGGVSSAACAGPQAAHRRVGAGDLRHPAGDDLVVRHLRYRGGGLPTDVPHRPRRV